MEKKPSKPIPKPKFSIETGIAVEQIENNGTSNGCEVFAYLVFAAGFYFCFNESAERTAAAEDFYYFIKSLRRNFTVHRARPQAFCYNAAARNSFYKRYIFFARLRMMEN